MNPPVLMSIDEALEKILTSAPDKPQYSSFESNIYKSLTDSHLRITARDVTAPLNIPPFPASAMDGYAVASSDNIFTEEAPYLLPLQGKSLAGNPFTKELLPNQCIRTTTGACLPDRADSIVIQENVVIKNDNIQILTKPEKLDHVREIGQDVKHKQLLFPEGTQLGPLQLGWLAACGIPEINVYRKIRMAVFSTGDELKEPGSTLKAGEIFEANRLVLEKLGNTLPVEITDLGILPDDEKQISDALKTAAKDADIILTSGGVSVGDADYVKKVITEIGQLSFWKIAIKPGKPVAYGKIGNALFFGLPGNPVSAIVTYLLLVKPTLAQMCGLKDYAPPLKVSAILETPLKHSSGRTEYQRATYRQVSEQQKGGTPVLCVSVKEDQSSNRFASFRACNCLIEIPEHIGSPQIGDEVTILPLHGLLD